MPVERTRYVISEWGVGDLWIRGEIVLAHDFHFGAAETDGDRARLGAGRLGAVRPRTESLGAEAPPEPLGAEALLGAEAPKGERGPPRATLPAVASRMANSFVPVPRRCSIGSGSARSDELVERFAALLAGDAVTFDDVDLDLAWATPFQRSVLEALRSVPRGEIVTYGELAALAAHPGAARATGSLCARNPFAFIVPCHRVVGSNGIGGYGCAGIEVKRRLLALEGVAL